jgi:Zn-finger nucleic acid-binding protein
MKCPNCEETLVMAERQGVEIDYCPKCRGVWLDKGELDKIIEKSAAFETRPAQTNQPPDPYYDNRDKRDYYEKNDPRYYDKNDPRYRKKKGFLGDFFDFD